MDSKLKKKIKKELSKFLPKSETISSKIQGIQSEFRKFKSELTGVRPTNTDSEFGTSGYRNRSQSFAGRSTSSTPGRDQHSSSFDNFGTGPSSSKINESKFEEYLQDNDDFPNSVQRPNSRDRQKSATSISSRNLSNDFQSMFDSGLFSDIVIKCGSDIFRAHKCVLSARSPVFQAMFSSPMRENERDEVVIEDIESSVFQVVLSFIYSGQVEDLDVPKACDLLYSAEKYQITDLKDICVGFLKTNLSIENCLDVLEKAELYDENLNNKVVSFICETFCTLQTTQRWKDMQQNNPSLALKVYSNVVERLQNKK